MDNRVDTGKTRSISPLRSVDRSLLVVMSAITLMATACGDLQEGDYGPVDEAWSIQALDDVAPAPPKREQAQSELTSQDPLSTPGRGVPLAYDVAEAFRELTGERALSLRTAFVSQVSIDAFIPRLTLRSLNTLETLYRTIDRTGLSWDQVPALAAHVPAVLGQEYAYLATDMRQTIVLLTAGDGGFAGAQIPGWVKIIWQSKKPSVMSIYLSWLYHQHQEGRRFAKSCSQRFFLYKSLMKTLCELPNHGTDEQCVYSTRGTKRATVQECDCPEGVFVPRAISAKHMTWKSQWNHQGWGTLVSETMVCARN